MVRKLILYRSGRYRQNLLYQCLGRYRNALVSFRFRYQLYQSYFGHTGINIGFQLENRYRTKQKNSQNPPNFKIHLLTLTSVFPPLLRICLCDAFLLLFLCFAGLCFYSPFIFFIYFSTCLSLFLVLVHPPKSRKVVTSQSRSKWHDFKAKRVGVKIRMKKINK